jgi:hydrogenase nickel incorporation protein HypA/HybF
MHEFPITQQIIKIAEKHCKLENAAKVTKVTLVVGDYSGFIGESIDMYFGIISEGTLCEGAAIEIERVKPKLECTACSEIFEKVPMSFACPKCGADGKLSEAGKEFYIKEIEVEK